MMLNRRARIAAVALVAATSLACNNPLEISTWLNVQPGSTIFAANSELELEGGMLMRINIDLSNLFKPSGTIHIDQVKLAGANDFFGTLCMRKDIDNDVVGSFEIDILAGTQTVHMPLATIASTSAFEALFGEIYSVAEPEDIEFPISPELLAPLFVNGSLDGALTLPVVMNQEFAFGSGSIPAVIDLTVTSSSAPPEFSRIWWYCEFKWILQEQPFTHHVNPRGTYLHHVAENQVQGPLMIDLAELFLSPGDRIRIQRRGSWTGFFQTGYGMTAVFSETDELKLVTPPAYILPNFWYWLNFRSNRVTHSVEAGADVMTPRLSSTGTGATSSRTSTLRTVRRS